HSRGTVIAPICDCCPISTRTTQEPAMKALLQTMLLAGLLGLPAAYAQDDLTRIRDAGVIRIATEGTYAPFTFHDASGLTGFDVEIGRAIAQRLGVEARFVEGKW